MPQATLFKNNRSQAVRLPKAAAFPEGVEKVEVLVLGKARLLTPVAHVWDDWFAQPPAADFPERECAVQPEREGLDNA